MPQVPEPFIKIKYFHEYLNQNIYKNNKLLMLKLIILKIINHSKLLWSIAEIILVTPIPPPNLGKKS